MSDNTKTLLSEAQVRQFMKLARLEPLTPGFIHGLTEDEAYTAKKEDPRADKRQGAKKRAGEGTLAKTKGHGRVDYVNEEADDEEIDESHGRGRGEGAGGYGSPDAHTRLEEDDEEFPAPEDELGLEDELADEEGGELEDLEGLDLEAEPAEDGGRMISVDDFLAALEGALESALGDEVEIDSEEMEDELPPDEEELEVGLDIEEPLGDDEEISLDATEMVEEITKRVAARIVKEALKSKK